MYYSSSYHSSIRVRRDPRKPVIYFHHHPNVPPQPSPPPPPLPITNPSPLPLIIEMPQPTMNGTMKRSSKHKTPPPPPQHQQPPSIKLSPLSMYDEMTRFTNMNNVIDFNDVDKIITLAKNFDECRKKWSEALETIHERDETIAKQREEIHRLTIQCESMKKTLTHEINLKNELQNEYNVMRKTITILRSIVSENNKKLKNNLDHYRSINCIVEELNDKYNNVDQVNSNDHTTITTTSDTDTGSYLFDKSDDGLDSINHQESPIVVESKIHTDDSDNINIINNNNGDNRFATIIEVNDEDENEINETNADQVKVTAVKQPELALTTIRSSSVEPKQFNDNKQQQYRPRPLPMPRTKNLVRNQSSKLEANRLDTRPHQFMEKKAFKTTLSCTVCSLTINFYSTYYTCSECRAIVHNNCRNYLACPCLPYMIPNVSIKKMLSLSTDKVINGGKFLIIGDFVPDLTRPCVPAILIHCCNEIDRRIRNAMNESLDKNTGDNNFHNNQNKHKKKYSTNFESPVVGVYRISATDQDVRELRNRILRAEHGIPNLSHIDSIHTICGVVKMFLRDLDDSLVSRIMWHNFVRASNQINEYMISKQFINDTDDDDDDDGDGGDDIDDDKPDSGVDDNLSEQTKSDGSICISINGGDCNNINQNKNNDKNQRLLVLKKVICELPLPHRDSLAFLIRHLNFVARCENVTLMKHRSLATVFAPTIVGNSEFCRQSPTELQQEIPKQIMVMNALFEIDNEFWQKLLTEPDFSIQSSFVSQSISSSSTNNNTHQIAVNIRKKSTSVMDLSKTIKYFDNPNSNTDNRSVVFPNKKFDTLRPLKSSMKQQETSKQQEQQKSNKSATLKRRKSFVENLRKYAFQ